MKRLMLGLVVGMLSACSEATPSSGTGGGGGTTQTAFPPSLNVVISWTITNTDLAKSPNRQTGKFTGALTRSGLEAQKADYEGNAGTLTVSSEDDLPGQGVAKCTTTANTYISALTGLQLLALSGQEFVANFQTLANGRETCVDNGTVGEPTDLGVGFSASAPTAECTSDKVRLPVSGSFSSFTSTETVTCGTKQVVTTFEVTGG